jgi:hypothetical protein
VLVSFTLGICESTLTCEHQAKSSANNPLGICLKVKKNFDEEKIEKNNSKIIEKTAKIEACKDLLKYAIKI